MGAIVNLGNDPVLAPNGIDATGQMEDESIGAQQNTDFIVKITNNSATPVPNYRVFVSTVPAVGAPVTVFPDHVHIVNLAPGETEECHFLVRNHTGAIQSAYTFQVQSNYFGAITNTYDNFVRP